jgi:hypothetical protein
MMHSTHNFKLLNTNFIMFFVLFMSIKLLSI